MGKAADHMEPAVREQREMKAGAQGLSLFYAVQGSGLGNGAAHIYGGSSHLDSHNQIIPYRHSQRFVSKATLDPVMLTVHINHHTQTCDV